MNKIEIAAKNINVQRRNPPMSEIAQQAATENREIFAEWEQKRLAGESVPTQADVLTVANDLLN